MLYNDVHVLIFHKFQTRLFYFPQVTLYYIQLTYLPLVREDYALINRPNCPFVLKHVTSQDFLSFVPRFPRSLPFLLRQGVAIHSTGHEESVVLFFFPGKTLLYSVGAIRARQTAASWDGSVRRRRTSRSGEDVGIKIRGEGRKKFDKCITL